METLEHEPLQAIKKIHFLIHPGSASENSNIGKSASELSRYIKKASTLTSDELMILYVHKAKKYLGEDMKEAKCYTHTILELRKILGRRLIIFSEDSGYIDIQDDRDVPLLNYELIKEVANARGYDFDENVESEAYGEYWAGCVSGWANALYEGLKLVHPINIMLAYTEAPEEPHEITMEKLAEVRKTYRNLIYIINPELEEVDR